MKQVKVTVIYYKELENLIVKHYNEPQYMLMWSEKWLNGNNYVVKDVGSELSEHEEKKLREFRENPRALFTLPALMKDLYANGVLTRGGTYIIET